MVVAAFTVAVAAALALIGLGLALRDNGSVAPTPTPGVDLSGIPQQGRVLGDPSSNVTLIEYADAQCPACRFYTEDLFPTVVNEYVRPGKITNEFRGFPFIGPDSVKAYRFLLAAAEQDRLWQLQEALYRNQGRENEGWVTDELIRRLAGEIPGLDADKLFTDAERDDIREAADAAVAEAEAADVPGTPALYIKIGDDEPYYIQVASADEVRAALDDALGG
jgi:protein-disulfide isomerase